MADNKIKSITVRMTEDLHRKVKVKVAEDGITLQDYIIKLIEADLKKGGK